MKKETLGEKKERLRQEGFYCKGKREKVDERFCQGRGEDGRNLCLAVECGRLKREEADGKV